MYKKSRLGSIIGLLVLNCLSMPVVAQVESGATGYYNYVPVFSGQTVYGTARMQGLAGAGVSLGGDIGQIASNPATLGFFRKSEVSLSMGIGSTGNRSEFLGNSTNANRTWFGIPNFGAVINFSKDDLVPGIFRGGSLGISFTKVNDYQQRFLMSGTNSRNSFTDYLVENANAGLANGRTFDDVFNEDPSYPNSLDALAFNSHLIDYDSFNGEYTASIGVYGNAANAPYYNRAPYYNFALGDQAQQKESVLQKAGQYSWDISYGANINDRIYLGIGGSILISNYQQERVFEEKHLPFGYQMKDFTFRETDVHKGTGYVAKAGIIVKATDWLRLGGSIHSPTYNYMRETYSWGIVGNFDNVLIDSFYNTSVSRSDLQTTTNSFNYRFVKPMRASAGITLLAGKRGFITADVEYVPYKTASLQYPGDRFLFMADNATIKNIYNNVFNYKLGAEVKVTNQHTLRGGFAYNADPYNRVDDLKRDQYNFTLGAGYRIEGFYVDLAVVQGFTNQRYKPYTLNNGEEPTADIKKHYGFYQVTAGFTF
ncbi:MAG: hypothetical protein K0R51_1263 [Cytophagaceae bacterium]|nr:hypothetical protein [Cytophagaceae bacterium]